MEEKRKSPRFARKDTVIFALKENPHLSNQSQLLDISMGGLKFYSPEQYPVGTIIILKIQFPFLYPQLITLESEVVHTETVVPNLSYTIGVKFVNLNPETTSALEEMQKRSSKNT